MIGYIYRTTNKINGKTYIGKKHKQIFVDSYYGSGIVISSAIKKYGKENFEVVLIATADSLEDLNLLERQFILNEHPKYNLAPGGDGGDIISNLENKNDIRSRATSGIKKWHASLSEEDKLVWAQNISNSRHGNFREGSHFSDESKLKSSISNKLAWEKDDGSRALKVKEAMAKRKGIPNTRCYRPVVIDEIEYEAITIAAKILNVSRRTINNWLKTGKAKYVP
jgi:group I intron endonuclease